MAIMDLLFSSSICITDIDIHSRSTSVTIIDTSVIDNVGDAKYVVDDNVDR